MIEMLDVGLEKVVAYRVDGKVTADEMAALFAIFRERVEKDEDILIYQEVTSFGGVEFEAIVEKFKFLKEFGLSHFEKIAVVTSKKWLASIVDLEDKIFRSVKMKGFTLEQKDQAVAFLAS